MKITVLNKQKRMLSNILVHNQEDNIFVFVVNSVIKLNRITNFVSVDVSFQQASRLYQSVKEKKEWVSWGPFWMLRSHTIVKLYVLSICRI